MTGFRHIRLPPIPGFAWRYQIEKFETRLDELKGELQKPASQFKCKKAKLAKAKSSVDAYDRV
ncbi:hypothetical protein P3T21_004408 [Paraburkholderia sp. GAS334]